MNNTQMILGATLITILCFTAVYVGARILWKQSRPVQQPDEPHIEENAEPGILFYAGTKYAKLLTLSQIAEKNHHSQTYYDQITERNTVLETPLDLEIWNAAYNSHMNRMLRERQYPLVLFNEDGTTTRLADRDEVMFYRAARAADFDLKIIKQRMPATGEKQGSNDSE